MPAARRPFRSGHKSQVPPITPHPFARVYAPQLLSFDPTRRPSAAAALRLPFFAELLDDDADAADRDPALKTWEGPPFVMPVRASSRGAGAVAVVGLVMRRTAAESNGFCMSLTGWR